MAASTIIAVASAFEVVGRARQIANCATMPATTNATNASIGAYWLSPNDRMLLLSITRSSQIGLSAGLTWPNGPIRQAGSIRP